MQLNTTCVILAWLDAGVKSGIHEWLYYLHYQANLSEEKRWKGETIMRNFSYIAMSIMLSVMVVFLFSCISGGTIDPNDPLKPSPDFNAGPVDPVTKAMTIEKDGIIVRVEHWSKNRLDRKYTTIDMRSPFFFVESWEQTYQSEVFHIKIVNNNTRKINVVFKETILEDEREYIYQPMMFDFLKYKFQTKKMMDLKTKNGMEKARRMMLTEILGKSGEIKGGQTVEGFLPFTIPSTQAVKVWLTLSMEKEPEIATKSYEQVSFRFDYIQDLVLRSRLSTIRR